MLGKTIFLLLVNPDKNEGKGRNKRNLATEETVQVQWKSWTRRHFFQRTIGKKDNQFDLMSETQQMWFVLTAKECQNEDEPTLTKKKLVKVKQLIKLEV